MYKTLYYPSKDMLIFDILEKILGLGNLGMIFQEECFTCHILLTDQILFSEYIYFLRSKYFLSRWMVCQPCSIVQNLVVNYHLVVSYSHQCHTGINVSHYVSL